MTIFSVLDHTHELSSPPPGSINVDRGRPVEGPGGRWVPCATQIAPKRFVPGLFRVGPGQKQVCANGVSFARSHEALAHARSLALSASA